MKIEGGCYCGALRYRVEGDPALKIQCHCRECQYIAGGGTNFTIGMPQAAFTYTKGTPKAFRRADLPTPVTREFCGDCGTHVAATAPAVAGVKLIKVGTMDDPKQFGGPELVIFTVDKQPFHQIPAGVPSFERFPG